MRTLLHALFCCALLIVLSGTYVPTASAQVTPLLLGLFLKQSLQKVDEIIEHAKEAGRELTIEAGQRASLAISQAQVAYADSLELTVSKTRNEIQNTVANIETMLLSLEKQTAADVHEAEDRAQVIVNALPRLGPSFPQVVGMTPRLAELGRDDFVNVVFRGNFVNAAQRDMTPLLTIDGKHKLGPTEITTNRIGFRVPRTLLGPSKAAQITVVPLDLGVPYRSGLFNNKKDAVFRVPLALLPESPGTISLIVRNNNPTLEQREHSASVQTAEGRYDNDTIAKCEAATPGWKVVRGDSLRWPDITNENGARKGEDKDWHDYPMNTTDTEVCWYFEVDEGYKIEFRIPFREERIISHPSDVTETIKIGWRSKVVRAIPDSGTWTVVYEPFDGTHQEFAAPGTSSPSYLSVGIEGNFISISTIPPPAID